MFRTRLPYYCEDLKKYSRKALAHILTRLACLRSQSTTIRHTMYTRNQCTDLFSKLSLEDPDYINPFYLDLPVGYKANHLCIKSFDAQRAANQWGLLLQYCDKCMICMRADCKDTAKQIRHSRLH